MANRLIGLLLCGGVPIFAALTPSTASAAAVSFTCSPTKVNGSASALVDTSTTSGTFVNIPEAAVNFHQGGVSASCVIVRFSAEAYSNNLVIVRAYLDRTTAALPNEVIYTGHDPNFLVRVRSYEFVFPSVAPGNHTVRMQFRSGDGESALVTRYNTIVQFAP
jgi:hypothetical protein